MMKEEDSITDVILLWSFIKQSKVMKKKQEETFLEMLSLLGIPT